MEVNPTSHIRRYTPKFQSEDEKKTKQKLKRESLSAEQLQVFEGVFSLLERGGDHARTISIVGYAGTGKTTLTAHIVDELRQQKKKVGVLSLTGKAISVLRRKMSLLSVHASYVGTIHSLIYEPVEDANGKVSFVKVEALPEHFDVLVIDEASMVSDKLLDDILSFQVPVLLVGDFGQLPPIDGICTAIMKPDFSLREIHRQAQDNPLIQFAAHVRKSGLEAMRIRPPGIEILERHSLKKTLHPTFAEYGLSDTVILCYQNKDRLALNELCLHQVDLEGVPVVCLRNAPPIYNGMRGICTALQETKEGQTVVDFDYEGLELTGSVCLDQFGHPSLVERAPKEEYLFDWAYAMTGHKAQGSAFKHVLLTLTRPHMVNDFDYKRWLYTGITRASEKVTIIL